MKHATTLLLLMLFCSSASAQNMTLQAIGTEYRLAAYHNNTMKSGGQDVGNNAPAVTNYTPANKVPGTTTGLKRAEARTTKITAVVNGLTHTAEGGATSVSSISSSLVTPLISVGGFHWSRIRTPTVNPPDNVVATVVTGVGAYTFREYKVNDSRENIVNSLRATLRFKATVNTNRDETANGKVELIAPIQVKARNTDLKLYYDRGYEVNQVKVGAWFIEGTHYDENGVLKTYSKAQGTAIIVTGDDIDKTIKITDSFPQGGVLKPELWIHSKDPFTELGFPGMTSRCGSKNLTGVNHQVLDEEAAVTADFQILGVYPLGGTPPNWP